MHSDAQVQAQVQSQAQVQAKRSWYIGLICVLGAQILFGTTFAVNKFVISQDVDPVLMGFNRAWIAIVCLFPFYRRNRGTTRWTPKDWRLVFFVGAFATAGAMILEYMGTEHTAASNVSLIISTESVLAILLAVLILKEKLRLSTIFGGVGAMVGMALVLWEDIQTFQVHGGSDLFGDLLVTASVFLWCLYTINSKRILQNSEPLIAHFFITIFSCFTLGLVSFLRGSWPAVMEMSLSAWIGTLYLGGVCSGFAHWLYFQALKRLPASLVSLTLTLLPVFGVTFSILLLGETLSINQAIGGLAIAAGVGYAVWPQDHEVPIPEEAPPGA
ncbi:MAG: DMT family transporter [Candidatus Omnitrophica bacterium]|nr:DMT family transporter [Candidatus Omnitrophota bacterium]